MSSKLKKSPQTWKLAADLGLKPTDDPVRDILHYCERKIRRFLKDFPDCETPSDLLGWVAGRVGTFFEIVDTDEKLRQIKEKYLKKGEKIFVQLEKELADDVFGVTLKLTNQESWEPQYVSIIDCRGEKAFRSYYTKWHEIAHLLVLTDQTRLAFWRTHCNTEQKNPEEVLMDIIAGKFGFYPQLLGKNIRGEISFEVIEKLRLQLYPEASQQASLIGFVKAWPTPCLLVHAEMAFRKNEQAQLNQQTFDFQKGPAPALRAVHVTANDLAREAGLIIFENMRVPEKSVICRVFNDDLSLAEAEENLSSWETSDGTRLKKCRVRVMAKRSWDSAEALIIPID